MNTDAQLPISGAFLTGAAVTQQWTLMVTCLAMVTLMIVLVRVFWRRGKKVNDR
jgi:uncharacterized membrane protein